MKRLRNYFNVSLTNLAKQKGDSLGAEASCFYVVRYYDSNRLLSSRRGLFNEGKGS